MFLRYNLFTFSWAIIVAILSIVAGGAKSNIDVSFLDKIVHAFMYAVLCLLMIVGYTKQYTFRFLKFKPILWAIVFSCTYGIILEVIQHFIPDRSFDVMDMIANAAGSLIGLLAFYIIYKL